MTRRPAPAPEPPKRRTKPVPPPRPGVPAQRSLDRLEQVRVLAHPLRLRLLEVFAESPCTTKQAADRLGLPPTRLYHHVAALERVGLVRVRETRRNRGTIEKYYEAIARGFEADPARLARGRGKAARAAASRLANESIAALVMRVLERTSDNLMAALDATAEQDLDPEDVRRPLAIGAGIRGTPEELVTIRGELLALLERWQSQMKAAPEADAKESATMRAWLTIVFAPEVESPEESKKSKAAKKGGGRTSGSGGRKPGGGT